MSNATKTTKQLPAISVSTEIYSDIVQFPCDSTALIQKLVDTSISIKLPILHQITISQNTHILPYAAASELASH